MFEEVTPYFCSWSHQPTLALIEEAKPVLEHFTVILYHHKSNMLSTNECRKDFLCQGRSIDNIPTTSAALMKHILSSPFTAGHVWEQAMVQEAWGWKEVNGKLFSDWMSLLESTIGIHDLTKCSCSPEKCCNRCCKCSLSELPCTELCHYK